MNCFVPMKQIIQLDFQGLSKSFEGGFRAFISVDFFKSKEKTEKKKVSPS